jgi:uncharacterized protein (TIGR02118 family)
MYCVSIAYPTKGGGTFDFDYYAQKHIPMVTRLLGANVDRAEVRKGVASPDGSAASFVCMANIWIKSVDEFQAALAKYGNEIMGDIPHFTNIQPILQVDEVVMREPIKLASSA